MKKYTKHIALVAFLFCVLQSSAQEKNKYSPGNERTKKAREVIKDIDRFVADNLNNYDLTPKREAQVRKRFGGREKAFSTSKMALEMALHEAKVIEMKRLYFTQYATDAEVFRVDNVENRTVCSNGGFESGYSDDYVFGYSMLLEFPASCTMDTPALAYLGPDGVNDFEAEVTLVNNDVTVSGGNDPALNALGINIPRVHTGNAAIKLNNNTPLSGVTSMVKEFSVDGEIVSFYYSMIAQNPLDHTADEQPHFVARLYDSDNNIVDWICVVPTMTNPVFGNADNHPTAPLLYTGWQCAKLETTGMEQGELARLEFIITDCGQAAHYGTVYIDDICDSPNCDSIGGQVVINPNGAINCPALPINICGTYTLPATIDEPAVTGTLQSVTLKIKQGGVTQATLTSFTLGAGNTFCFQATSSNFTTAPVGDYEYEVNAEFLLNGITITKTDSTAVDGPDVTFEDCSDDCVTHLIVSTDIATGIDIQQAKETITASNSVTGTTYAKYHAGRQLLFVPGFDIFPDAEGYFYLEGCVGSDTGQGPKDPGSGEEDPVRDEQPIELVSRNDEHKLKVYPNPAVNEITLNTDNIAIKDIALVSLDGKTVITRQPKSDLNRTTYKVDVSAISKGVYLLTVKTSDGQTRSAKVIKK